MNVDEALLIADALDQSLDGKGVLTAAVVLAREVRRQHAEIERLVVSDRKGWAEVDMLQALMNERHD